jgi:hypothetical protein
MGCQIGQAANVGKGEIPCGIIATRAFERGQRGGGIVPLHGLQNIIDHPGVSPSSPVHNLAHLGLARAYTMATDKAHARTAYQDFLALWKDADPDIPILQQAKAEYAKLQ